MDILLITSRLSQMTANVFCNGDQCVCRTAKVANCDQFMNLNLTNLAYNGQHDYFGVQKADQWEMDFGPAGNTSSVFVYTRPDAFLGYEVVPGQDTIPSINLVMKRWDNAEPDANVFDFPDSCTQQPRKSHKDLNVITSMFPADHLEH